ncbi:amidohydrolase family protein [Croceitalea dokdonensis]|uniref:amidohydrolase family protein n=1 Tax=Croceitalea dokdonensis TaxID=346188 RepID=UPI0006CA02ED|nr:amidohydrolase family protein [Croceitalea dokdonensis]
MKVAIQVLRALCCLLVCVCTAHAQKATQDTIKKATKELPLEPERNLQYTTEEGTWISLDVSPDGQTIVFDLMGDLYTLPLTGGKATALTSGMAYEVHPRFSPDGKSLVYISDKSGSDNIWTMNLGTMEEKQITEDKKHNFFSAAWTPDGNYIVGVKGRRSIKPHIYHKDGGSGSQLVIEPKNIKLIDPAFSADGKLLYFSQRNGAWNYNAQLPQYQIATYDMEDADLATITSKYGSAFTPTLSPDGKWLVYGTRYEAETGLVLRNLITGDEAWLAYPVQRDEQESIAPLGVLPAMAFTPDSKELIVSYGGKIHRISVAEKVATEIPFSVDVNLDLGPRLAFKYPITDAPEAFATQIRNAKPSPDGSKLAFTALNRLYVMDYPNGTPKRLTKNNFIEAHPSWSPDGKQIVFTTWETDGGHVYKVNVTGAQRITKLTESKGIYTYPEWSYQKDRIAFLRGSAQVFQDLVGPLSGRTAEDLVWVNANGGPVQFIDKAKGRTRPHFTKVDDRIYLFEADRGLLSIRWDGSDQKEHLKLKGIVTFGSQDIFHDAFGGHDILSSPKGNEEPNDSSSEPEEIRIAPDGTSALAKINNDIYQVIIPKYGQTPTISLAKAEKAAFPAVKLTIMGGEFPVWSSNGKQIHWSLGASYFSYDLEAGQKFRDSLAAAKSKEKAVEKEKEQPDSTKTKKEKDIKDNENAFRATELAIKVPYLKDIPKGDVLLKGARLITMAGKEIIEKGDIWIHNNRIKQLGISGSILVSKETKVIDVSGKTIIPGFVDTHAHMRPAWGIHKNQVWSYTANLAYGVTTTRDPQTGTTDVLTYSDMVESGQLKGPRIYSTGPGLGFWFYQLTSLEQTKEVLKQYSNYFDTKTIKMYLVGNRQQRQWVIEACKELKLMPTTEGGLDFKLNMTQLLDGYPGHEHSFPIYPIYKDVLHAVATSQMAVTPTLLVSYGGPWAENYYYSREDVWGDEKLQHFTPYSDLARKSRRRPGWFMEEEHVFKKHAAFMKALVEANGIAGIGSHGQLQGLGFHWELWSVASAGMEPHDALRIATIIGAEAIGLDGDLGSLEAGKVADILVLDKNPLEDLRNTNTLSHVIKNGKIYEADTLNEIWPEQKEAGEFRWQTKKPEGLPGIK